MLVPVNYDKADAIHTKTGVVPIKGDANAVLVKRRGKPTRFSFVWLDVQSTTVPAEAIETALSCADFLGMTLSTRCKGVEAVLRWASAAVRDAGGEVVESGSYAGISGFSNMVRIVAAPKRAWDHVVAKQRRRHFGPNGGAVRKTHGPPAVLTRAHTTRTLRSTTRM